MAIEPVYDPRATSVPVLRYLVAVADHGTFSRAAEACGVAQPTLSVMVAQWEKRMRIKVFERSTHGVTATPAGQRIVAAARAALSALRQVEVTASTASTPPFHGPLRLGLIPTVAPYALPFITRAIEGAFPGLDVPVREATTGELLAMLARDGIDVAVLATRPDPTLRLTVLPLYVEPFLAALPRGHALAKEKAVAAADLVGQRLLLLAEGHCLRDQALSLCALRAESAGGADYRATSLETLRHLVAAGAGVTVLPALAAPDDDDRRVTVRPLADEAARTVVLCWREDDPRAAAYQQLGPPIRRALPAAVRPAR